MDRTKEQIYKGIQCCSEFLCGECPYKEWESQGSIKCIHMLMMDIKENLIVLCEDCDSAYPCFSPFDRKNYVRCTYLATGDGKVVPRRSFCAAGERRKDNACE